MKTYSSYLKRMITAGLICFVLAVISFNYQMPNACAGMSAMSFVFLWVASMAPDHEKYKNHER